MKLTDFELRRLRRKSYIENNRGDLIKVSSLVSRYDSHDSAAFLAQHFSLDKDVVIELLTENGCRIRQECPQRSKTRGQAS